MAVILLAFLHLFAFDAPWLNWPHEWLSANGWELVLLVGYLQHFVSLSQLELLAMPSFLAQFGDAFAWSAFLVQRTALVHSMPSRRHDEATIAKGVDAFGDRIGIYDASDLVVNGVVGVAVVFGVLCFVFFALWVCGHHVPEDKFDLESSVVSAMAAAPTRRRGTLWVLGFGVTLWFVALYPLTALATFDLESVHANTALAVVILVIVAVVLLGAFAYAILSKSDEQLMSINSLKVFGALYADVTYGCRWFFVVTALAQIALGVCVGAIRDESTQLTVALVITIGYLAIVLLCSPFTSQTPLLLTIAVGGLKVLNYSIAFAFVSEKKLSMAARNRAGDAIVVLTMLVMLLWLVRVLVMLATFVRLYAERRSAVAETPAFYGARESVKEGMNLDTNPILGGSGVYVTLMMSPPQRLGSEHGNSLDELLPRRTGRLAQL